MEVGTNIKEQYFREGLKETVEMMAALIKFNDEFDLDVSKVVFTFNRSLSTGIGYFADALSKLSSFLSKQAIISWIPFAKGSDCGMDLMNLEQGQDYPSSNYKLGDADNDEKESNSQ